MAAFPGLPAYLADHAEFLRQIARVTNNLLLGKLNVGGIVSLQANAASTILTDARIGSQSAVLLVPTTASAAAELATGALYVPETGRINGSAVIAHANNALADRTFRYAILG
jgi:hypothetical protein